MVESLKELRFIKISLDYHEEKLFKLEEKRRQIKEKAARAPGDGSTLHFIDREIELVEKVLHADQRKYDEIMECMEGLDERESLVMELRYSEGLSWQEVADSICYSVGQTHRFHRAALAKIKRTG